MIGIVTALGGIRATAFAAALLAASVWGGLQYIGKTKVERDFAAYKVGQEMALAAVQKQSAERYATLVNAMSKIGDDYEKRLRGITAAKDKLAADLRTERVKLREELTCPTVAGSTPADLARADAAARLREQIAAETIADADHADAWIVSLQEVIRKYQEVLNGRK